MSIFTFGFGSVVESKHGHSWTAPLEMFWSSPLLRAGSTGADCPGPCPLGFEYLCSVPFLGNLCLATLTVKSFIFIFKQIFCQWALLGRSWLCLLCSPLSGVFTHRWNLPRAFPSPGWAIPELIHRKHTVIPAPFASFPQKQPYNAILPPLTSSSTLNPWRNAIFSLAVASREILKGQKDPLSTMVFLSVLLYQGRAESSPSSWVLRFDEIVPDSGR